jgi:anti-sigma factor RsiW
MADPITEADLHAFIDGQLEAARRIEVEDYLARHPDVAAQVMADLRVRDMLQLAFTDAPARPSLRLLEAARRLERSFAWRRIGLPVHQAAAIAFLIGLGWVAHDRTGVFEISDTEAAPRPPAFVVDAQHAHETAQLRARMVSQVATPVYHTAEILKETGITLPALPASWRVADLQVFPSHEGHSIEVSLEAPSLGRMSLFAAQAPASGTTAPTLARSSANPTVYWQSGSLAYALTGSAPEPALKQAALKLSHSLN